jgi:hypothetical protein
MNQISNSWSLFWRIFFPTFFIVFFGLGNLVFWFVNVDNFGHTNLHAMRLLFGIILLSGLLFFYKVLWRLKRVDIDETHLYVSNYFKAARYTFDQIQQIKEQKLLGRRVVNISLVGRGVFGISFSFLPDRVRYDQFCKNNPQLQSLYSN